MHYTARQTTRLGNRSTNQDRSLIVADEDAVLVAVADGMGGHARGDLAAQAMVDSLRRQFEQRDPIQEPGRFLADAMHTAHRTIIAVGRSQQPPIQPLTTGVACLISGDTAHWVHIGDSRLYLLRDNHIFFQTRDHTPLADMVDAGMLSERQARNHPLRNQVNRCLGGNDAPPDLTLGPTAFLQQGDVILLCTDGLWSPLEEKQLLELTTTDNLADTLETLAVAAESHSYPQSDNVTAVALLWEGIDLTTQTDTGQPDTSAGDADQDPLDRAIADIEQALAEYEDEMQDNAPANKRSQSV